MNSDSEPEQQPVPSQPASQHTADAIIDDGATASKDGSTVSEHQLFTDTDGGPTWTKPLHGWTCGVF